MPHKISYDQTTLVQVMDCCLQATDLNLNQCSPNYIMPIVSPGHNVLTHMMNTRMWWPFMLLHCWMKEYGEYIYDFFISTFVNYFLLPLQWLHQSIITTQDTDNSTLFNSLFGVMTKNDTFDWPLWVESIGGFHSQITSIASPYQKLIGFSEILKIILRIFYLSVIKLYNKTCISGDTKSPINLKELYVCIHTYLHACYTTICTTMYL